MKEIVRLISVLTVICAASGSLMAFVNDMTKGRIAEAKAARKIKAMRSVLPEFNNDPINDTVTISTDDISWIFNIAKNDDGFAGTAFVATSPEGYGGDITVMVGLNADGTIKSYEILPPMKETPGLGAKIADKSSVLYKAITGKHISKTNWKVKKDGGEIDEITAATISSRAVINAIKDGIDVYLANEEKITQ
ncbi:hypothetical protein BVX97_04560 [bacterium E08(2017)]|nr:hypothetical protein BVX97_04560 [bacterium E08(2017)]